jgi:hypothetical protein
MTYQLYHNQSSRFSRGYEAGDELVEGHRGQFPACFSIRPDLDPQEALLRLAEVIFTKHNRDDRPDGRTAPSLSVGDVVVIGEVAMTVESIGFTFVTLSPSTCVFCNGVFGHDNECARSEA